MTHKNHDCFRVLALIIPYIIICGVFQYVGSLIAEVNITDINAEKSSLQQLIIQVFNLLGTFTVLWIFMKYVDKEKFVKLGFAT